MESGLNSAGQAVATTNPDLASALSAIGGLIGYVGTEIPTDYTFERLLWPQRFYNGFCLTNSWKVALFMPMGGPMHKAALHALDVFYKKGLFKGYTLGHMLGTAFFADTGMSYQIHRLGSKPVTKGVRNGLWVRAINEMPMPYESELLTKPHPEDGAPLLDRVRQRITVSQLALLSRKPLPSSKEIPGAEIPHESGPCAPRIYLAIFTSEISGVICAIVVGTVWKSAFMVLWLIPLFLKLISGVFALDREDLAPPTRSSTNGLAPRATLFEVANTGNGFQVIEGDESVILQFFRHYGHPIRCRSKEIVQIGVTVSFGLLFPIGLLCSILWMSTQLQCLWLGYQLYATVAMHIYHYAGGRRWATTEEVISQTFAKAEAKHEDARLIFGKDRRTAVSARLIRTSHTSYGDGKAYVEQLISRQVDEKLEPVDSTASTEDTVLSPPT
ncbi:hypothetical protein MMC20_002395 [Loxospora ochrophaea]|nr:hypothetical protein [Loxospora ochrophaea]